jgi:hypothetical protein
MAELVTPRDEVLAVLTELGPLVEVPTAAVDVDALDGDDEPQAAVLTMTAPTTRVRIPIEREQSTVPSRDRITLPVGFQRFSRLICIAPSSAPVHADNTDSAVGPHMPATL